MKGFNSDTLRAHYQTLYGEYGDSPRSVQWSDAQTQQQRFAILADLIQPDASVIDVGCGLGELYRYLREHRGFIGCYTGVDFVPEFISHCCQAYPDARFFQADLTREQLPSRADYVLLSGVFNNLLEDNFTFAVDVIRKMYDACEKGVAFNALSKYVDYESEGLYYMDPLQVFDYCKRHITPYVTLRHDYLVKSNSIPFEFTCYLYKQP